MLIFYPIANNQLLLRTKQGFIGGPHGQHHPYMEPAMELQHGHQPQHTVGAKNGKSINNKRRKNRRGWGRKLKRKTFKKGQKETKFSIFGSNSNGIKGKLLIWIKNYLSNLDRNKTQHPEL